MTIKRVYTNQNSVKADINDNLSQDSEMKEFEHFKLNNYQDYVLLTSNKDIYFFYNDIAKLANKNAHGVATILVDLFYKNGFSFNRFIELVFSADKKQPISRIVNPRNIPDEIKTNTKNYFKQNKMILDVSTLSRSIKDFVLCG